MDYPFWYLLFLVFAWALIPPGFLIAVDRLRGRSHGIVQRHIQWIWAYVFVSASLAWSSLFLFFPLAHAIQQSFTDFNLSSATATQWIGLRNYTAIFGDPFWWRTLAVTAIYTLGTVPLGVLISMFLAVQILKQPPSLQTFFKAALYVPGVVSLVVTAAILKWIFHSGDGFANAVLQNVGLESQNWFGDPNLALPVLIAMVWLTANGVGVIVY